MNLLDYNLRQIKRSYFKKYENYVVTRLFHALGGYEDIQMVTQQYVKRPGKKRALTDLYFPQFRLHIEIDEPHHDIKENKIRDDNRQLDVIEATNHDFWRININESGTDLKTLNAEIDKIANEIIEKRNNEDFKPWKLGDEYINPNNFAEFSEKGYIDADENFRFRTITDASNFLGQNIKGMQKAFFRSKKYPDYFLWFPKFYKNNAWDNKLVDDEMLLKENGFVFGDLIQEKILYEGRQESHYEDLIKLDNKRLVFPRFIDNLGFVVYRFMGVYEVDKKLSSPENGMFYKRISKKFDL